LRAILPREPVEGGKRNFGTGKNLQRIINRERRWNRALSRKLSPNSYILVTAMKKKSEFQGITKPHRIINPMGKRLYTLDEAAIYLGRSYWSVRELVISGKIPRVQDEGGRKIFLDIHDLESFVERNKAIHQ
jgi:excisionase family DNA binding protein